MNLRRHEKDTPDVNITPLIDVVFLLLIFFMVTTTFKKETSIPIKLPEASSKSDPADTVLVGLEIIINKDGDFFIDVKSKGPKGKQVSEKKTVTNQKLKTLIRAIKEASGGNNKVQIYIRADAKSPHESFVKVMDTLRRLGFTRVFIIAVPPDK